MTPISTVAWWPEYGRFLSSGLAVGDLDGDTSQVEVAMCVARALSSAGNVGDSIIVYRINKSDGTFTNDRLTYPVSFNLWTIFGSTPALGDLDRDGKNDIVFATDDSIYTMRINASDSLVPVVPPFRFGRVPGWRLSGDQSTPQALVADIDNDDSLEVVANHQGDGNIWAFDIRGGQKILAPGFPLHVQGKVAQSCAITDLENDGVLDLIAGDEGGYLYAWALDSGSAYAQPWPFQYCNAWNTSCTGYKPATVAGYVYEDWRSARVAPYKWLETGTDNSLTEVPPASSVFTRTNGTLRTSSAGDRNYHFTGNSLESMREYTVSGKVKFDSSNAEFGINFYSQWPNDNKKYTLLRKSDGFGYLYYVNGTSWTVLDTLDTTGQFNDLMSQVGVWYHFKIKLSRNGAGNTINAWLWQEGIREPTAQGINKTHFTSISSGVVGVTSHTGGGNRYWSSISVISNQSYPGAFIAYENLVSDTVVDIKPFLPYNWQDMEYVDRLPSTMDTSGFVFDRTAGAYSVFYRREPGRAPPGARRCRIMPQTNLTWTDYEFTGKITKPDSSTYDSIPISLLFHYKYLDSTYQVKFDTDSTVKLIRGTLTKTYDGLSFDGGDSIEFRLRISTVRDDGIPTANTRTWLWVKKNGGTSSALWSADEYAGTASVDSGPIGFGVDPTRLSNFRNRYLLPIAFRDVRVSKLPEGSAE